MADNSGTFQFTPSTFSNVETGWQAPQTKSDPNSVENQFRGFGSSINAEQSANAGNVNPMGLNQQQAPQANTGLNTGSGPSTAQVATANQTNQGQLASPNIGLTGVPTANNNGTVNNNTNGQSNANAGSSGGINQLASTLGSKVAGPALSDVTNSINQFGQNTLGFGAGYGAQAADQGLASTFGTEASQSADLGSFLGEDTSAATGAYEDQAAASSLAAEGDVGTLGSASSLLGAAGGAVGGYAIGGEVANLTGGNVQGGQIGGAIGGLGGTLAGGAVAAEIGLELGSFAGPVGMVVGAVAGALIGSMFGSSAPTAVSQGSYTPAQGLSSETSLTRGGASAANGTGAIGGFDSSLQRASTTLGFKIDPSIAVSAGTNTKHNPDPSKPGYIGASDGKSSYDLSLNYFTPGDQASMQNAYYDTIQSIAQASGYTDTKALHDWFYGTNQASTTTPATAAPSLIPKAGTASNMGISIAPNTNQGVTQSSIPKVA